MEAAVLNWRADPGRTGIFQDPIRWGVTPAAPGHRARLSYIQIPTSNVLSSPQLPPHPKGREEEAAGAYVGKPG